jgi:uncharacterized membrane protein
VTPLLALLYGLAAAPALGASAPPPTMRPAAMGVDDAEDVEDVEEVTEVKTTLGGRGAAASSAGAKKERSLSASVVVGRLHSALVHFPIAWLLLLLLVDFVAFGLGREAWRQVGLYVLLGTALSFAPAIIAGFLRADQLPKAADTTTLLVAHRNLALVTAGIFAAALITRLARRNRLAGAWKWGYLALLVAATVAVMWTGHKGGRLVYGTEFLPW